jgi:hypothetical protein
MIFPTITSSFMARQPRIEYEGAFYHVTSRGNLKQNIFFEDSDREKYLEILRSSLFTNQR